ncbi:MAG: UDP-N-acetylglucosamine--LPS N-acetylglucosamine transferase [Candidatus Aminicenantes bacterium]|nr:UDP-N-acetylglucosamine--LPS N-acetylglucosamine transferase [Candidatus Aminicenantes bacterium]
MKIGLIASSGGHFSELLSLNSLWSQFKHFWVSFPSCDTKVLLKKQIFYHGYFPTNRNVVNFFRNFILAIRVLSKEKPAVLISTGAGICVPFFILGKLFFVKTIYIESMARIHRLSLTGKLVYLFSDVFIVQWPQLAASYKKAVYKGQVI